MLTYQRYHGDVQKNLFKVACLEGKVLHKCSFIESITSGKTLHTAVVTGISDIAR